MKRLFLLVTALVIAASVPAAAQLLWRVDGNGLSKPSFIFGTHHRAPSDIIEKTPGLLEAIRSVDRAIGELDMCNGALEQSQALMASYVMAPADSTLSSVMTPQSLSRLAEVMTSLTGQPVSAAAFNAFKPSLVATQIGLLQTMRAFPDFNPASQLDAEVLRLAAEAGVPTAGLETPEFQLALMFGTPISVQARNLAEMLDRADHSDAAVRSLAEAYVEGDLDRLWEIVNDPELGSTPEEVDRLVTSRNAAWVNFLLGMIPTASVLVVVGAGHLPGPGGLIRRLRDAGYTVTAVTTPV